LAPSPSPPPPPPLPLVISIGNTWETDGAGREEGAKSNDGEKVWSSIIK
jgi:hypothetical protein